MGKLAGKVAIISGSGRGIGRALALKLASEGANVVVNDLDAGPAAETVAAIKAAGGKAVAYPLDVASEEAIKAAVKQITTEIGKIDILVNNAGITRDGLLLRMKRSDWDEVLTTNLTAAFLLTQACLSGMMKQRWGRIINITSIVGQTGAAGQANYSASKAGLIGFTLSVAREVASRNITVNAVAPGYIATAMTEVLTDEQKQAITAGIPLGRQGADADIANAVVYLASNEAGYVTGHVLDVNGGMNMR